MSSNESIPHHAYFKETFNAQPPGPVTPQRRFGPCKNWAWSTSSCHLSVNFLGMAMWESQRTCPNGYLSTLQWNGRVLARFERKHLILNERSGEVLACILGSPFKWACSQLVGRTGNTNAWRSNSIYFPGLLQSLGPGNWTPKIKYSYEYLFVEFWWFIQGLSSYRGTTLWTSIETARKLLPYSRLSSHIQICFRIPVCFRIPICLLMVHRHFGSVFGVYIHWRSPSVSESWGILCLPSWHTSS